MKSRNPQSTHQSTRRALLRAFASAPLVYGARFAPVYAAAAEPRELRFSHTHTGEHLAITYFDRGEYQPDALADINQLLRDFRTEDVHVIDPALLDFVHYIQQGTGSRGAVEIISAYRSPATNEMLRQRSSGVAKKSYHMKGKALDIRLTDVSTRAARGVATTLGMGGVGYYPNSDFLHIDLGPVRTW